MNDYCRLAKEAVKNYLQNGTIIEPPKDLPENFYKDKAGVFVTIEEMKDLPRGECQRVLRGCIGTRLPTKKNIAQEIISNAIAAATRDYRFNPIDKKELAKLSFTVYRLEVPEPVNNLEKLNPKIYGIIVRAADQPQKCGLLLPDLEGVSTAKQQFFIACQKGGINPEKEPITLWRFKVKKFKN